jgi:hypothetical protein
LIPCADAGFKHSRLYPLSLPPALPTPPVTTSTNAYRSDPPQNSGDSPLLSRNSNKISQNSLLTLCLSILCRLPAEEWVLLWRISMAKI